MERVRVLIQKLQEQTAANEAPAALLATVRRLSAELVSLLPRDPLQKRERVVVLLPPDFVPIGSSEPPASPAPVPQPEAPSPAAEPEPATPVAAPEPTLPLAAFEPVETPGPVEATAPAAPIPTNEHLPEPYSIRPPVAPVMPPPTPAFNPLEEVPTLAQQAQPATPPPPAPAPAPVVEMPATGESLNDRLKRQERELAHKLTDAPIRDLRKGIGINDRFLFIAELFRGDEAMYERSIKTINGFDILPEAEYWINRELKVKLGWDDSTDTVQHFYGLVRRRFS
ncbi:MAG: hypothetical protein EOO16_13310 [Chitinophagaceae bacterium]|nr:MAG: hypothetical protein EOO16_13310 [Chitinophagaceae bacterium]